MTNTVTKPEPATHGNSLDRRTAKASIGVKYQKPSGAGPHDLGRVAVSLFFETLAEIGMSEKEAAYEMALDPAQLSRMKSGQARLSIDAMWRLRDSFWIVFVRKLNEAKGLCAERDSEVRIERISELTRLLILDTFKRAIA